MEYFWFGTIAIIWWNITCFTSMHILVMYVKKYEYVNKMYGILSRKATEKLNETKQIFSILWWKYYIIVKIN